MRRAQRNHSAAFKARVALEALKGEKTLAEMGAQHDVHADQITIWKSEFLTRATEIFGASVGTHRRTRKSSASSWWSGIS